MNILDDAKALVAKIEAEFSPAVQADVKAAENEVHTIVNDAKSYVEVNGLQDLEQLAITAVTAMVPGASWAVMLGALKTQAVAAGVKLVDGAEAVVAAKVQGDLLAVGKIAAPASAA